MKIIVGVHGLANKPDAATLESYWDLSIREGLRRNEHVQDADFRFISVYWADLLYKYPLHEDPAYDFDPLFNREPYRPASQLPRRYSAGWLDSVRAAAGAVGGGLIDAVRPYVGLDALADFVLAEKVRDLAFYYDDDRTLGGGRTAREVLMDEVAKALLLLPDEVDVMLIAHSMGSIIAYDALCALGQAADYALGRFVTIGSPLGLPTVKAKIAEARVGESRPRTPNVVTKSWVNFADRRDPVAFDAHLADDYWANSRGIQVRDDLVLNDCGSPYHKSYGYLRTPEMSEHIQAFLEGH